jgi:hypothetical protein
MTPFSQWLSQTSISLAIQTHTWVIPTIQSVHIIAIAVVVTSVFMIALRILRLAGSDQTLLATIGRFGPPLSGGLYASVATGAFMVIGEPVRELLSFSFWLKMSMLAAVTIVTAAFRIAVRRNEPHWEGEVINRWTTRSAAILVLFIWAGIIVSGRLIAYDSIWGSWSHVPKD